MNSHILQNPSLWEALLEKILENEQIEGNFIVWLGGGWTHPSEKISQIGSFPQVGMKIKQNETTT